MRCGLHLFQHLPLPLERLELVGVEDVVQLLPLFVLPVHNAALFDILKNEFIEFESLPGLLLDKPILVEFVESSPEEVLDLLGGLEEVVHVGVFNDGVRGQYLLVLFHGRLQITKICANTL